MVSTLRESHTCEIAVFAMKVPEKLDIFLLFLFWKGFSFIRCLGNNWLSRSSPPLNSLCFSFGYEVVYSTSSPLGLPRIGGLVVTRCWALECVKCNIESLKMHCFSIHFVEKTCRVILHALSLQPVRVVHFFLVGEFSRAFRCWPEYPLISLLLGVSYLHLACQKFHSTKHSSILHVSFNDFPLIEDVKCRRSSI